MDNGKFVCHDCIGDAFLRNEIQESTETDTCSYCHSEKSGWPLGKLANRIDEVFKRHYVFADAIPVFSKDDDHVGWEPGGEEPESIIEIMVSPENFKIAQDVKDFLAQDEAYAVARDGATAYYDGSVGYEERQHDTWRRTKSFNDFKQSVKHQNRFYMHEYDEMLTGLFSGIADYQSGDNLKAIREIGLTDEDKYIYRARKVEYNEDIVSIFLNPQKELSAPSKEETPAGRMNPAGIPVFYASFSMKTCVSEIRLPVGGKAVAGKFEIIRPLKVLDLTVFDKFPAGKSEFDPQFDEYYAHWDFLRAFHQEIRKPIQPSDENLEYPPAQAVTEFLKRQFNLDGIIFTSAQVSGSENNITLFNHASVVEIPPEWKPIENGNVSQFIGKYEYDWDNDEVVFKIQKKGTEGKEETMRFIGTPIPPSLRYVDNSAKLVEAKSISHKFDEIEISTTDKRLPPMTPEDIEF